MKQRFSSDRTLIIWDLDHTLYNEKKHKDLYGFYGRAKAIAALDIFPFFTFEEAKEIGIESYRLHRNAIQGFLPYAKYVGMDETEMAFRLHKSYHKEAYKILLEEYPDFIVGCRQTDAAFKSLKPLRHALLTQSDLQEWGLPCMNLMQYTPHFEPHALFGFREVNGHFKKSSTYPLEAVLKATNTRPDQVVFVEDSVENSDMAKNLDERIMNVQMCWGDRSGPVPDSVDLQVDSPLDLLNHIRRVYSPSIILPNRPSTPNFTLG